MRQCFRLGIHPQSWKTARGILLKKADKPASLAKSYRVISLLNSMGKVVERVAADAIASYCEAAEVLHESQMGSCRRQSAVDAVTCLIQKVHEAWGQKQLAAALFMDVKAAFNHVASSKLTDCMLELDVNRDLVQWFQSFMAGRRLQLVVDEFKCEKKLVDTKVPQKSSVSLILFAIYLSEIHQQFGN